MHIKQPIRTILILIASLIAIQLINSLTQGLISSFGIFPRNIDGLIGIPFAPWIHHSWQHLFSNAAPLSVLAFVVLQQGQKQFILVWLFISSIAGSAVWLLANEGYHAGASLMVFGLIGYIISHAIFSRQFFYILLALIICFLYAGVILSLTQLVPGVSWSSHFFGFIAGLLAGKVFANSPKKQSI